MNPLDQLRDEIVNLHLLADRLARKSAPYHDLVEAADAMRAQAWKYRSELAVEHAVNVYDTARACHAEGAKPSGAPAKWRVEVVHGRARLIVDASGDSGEQSFWINDADTDDEPGHAEFHARMLRIAIGRIVGAPAPASAQGEVCECGHIAAIHDDPHGDGAHGGSCLEIIGKCSDGSDDFCCCSEFHHAQ